MEHVIAIAGLVLTGTLVGVEFGVAAFTTPLVSKLPDEAYLLFRSGGGRLLGALMPFWYVGTLVVLIAGSVLTRGVLAISALHEYAGIPRHHGTGKHLWMLAVLGGAAVVAFGVWTIRRRNGGGIIEPAKK